MLSPNDHLNNFKSPYVPGSETFEAVNEFFIKLQTNSSNSWLASRGQLGKIEHKTNRGFKMEEFR